MNHTRHRGLFPSPDHQDHMRTRPPFSFWNFLEPARVQHAPSPAMDHLNPSRRVTDFSIDRILSDMVKKTPVEQSSCYVTSSSLGPFWQRTFYPSYSVLPRVMDAQSLAYNVACDAAQRSQEERDLQQEWKPRVRTVFTHTQLRRLEELFEHTRYPAPDKRAEVARSTGLSEETVRVWFKNHRARRKRNSNSPRSSKGH